MATRTGILKVISPAFSEEGVIPEKFTCNGRGVTPPIFIQNIPLESKSLALIMEDPDMEDPDNASGAFIHWVMWNIPPTDRIGENSTPGTLGKNSNLYIGFSPPTGLSHRYIFRIYALDTLLKLEEGADRELLENTIQGHIIAQGELVGHYERKREVVD